MIVSTLLRSVTSVVPAFALVSILGCLAGSFVLNIPHGELGVVVSVPLVVAFVLSRFLVLIVPSDPPSKPVRLNTLRFFIVLIAFVGFATAFVMLPSAAVYVLVGLREVAKGAFSLAGWAFLTAVLVLVIDILATFASCVPLAGPVGLLKRNAIECFWGALRTPTDLSMWVVNCREPMSNYH
jgi:hypothetical protein